MRGVCSPRWPRHPSTRPRTTTPSRSCPARPSDYERYLATDELLSLQKGPDEWVHRDELLFQTVHQSSELWLKLAWNEVAEAVDRIEAGELGASLRLLKRPVLCLRFVTAQLDMLEQMSPWEYQEIRKVLGHGSGFDLAGFRELRRQLIRLGEAFHRLRRAEGLSLRDLYVHGRDHEVVPAGRGAGRARRVDADVAGAALPGRRPGDRRQGDRDPGHAGRGARATDPQGLLSGALGGPERADRALEVRGMTPPSLRDEVTGLLQELIGPTRSTRLATRRALRTCSGATSRRTTSRAALRPRAGTREPRGASARRRRPVAGVPVPRTPCSPTRRSGSATRGRETSSTARCGGAVRST